MKLKRLRFKKGFRVVPGNRRSQAAEMVIPPGKAKATPAIAIAVRTSGSLSSRAAAPR